MRNFGFSIWQSFLDDLLFNRFSDQALKNGIVDDEGELIEMLLSEIGRLKLNLISCRKASKRLMSVVSGNQNVDMISKHAEHETKHILNVVEESLRGTKWWED